MRLTVGPVDAIAEYIDNSIQACSNNDVSRNINISLFLASRAQTLPSFLVLLDDGMGMNVQTIKEFATYSLDQESRYKMPRENETSFIGKFGVGAKQAGFYLGSRIKLFSKPKDSFLESAVVYSFCLDGEELQSRYEQQQVIYEGNVHCSPVSNDIELSGDEAVYNQMEELIQNHLRSVLHGSAFIIKLRPEIIKKLSEMDEGMLATEIKEIYHFHIHPENSFHVGVKGNTTGSRYESGRVDIQ
jgi:DNA topoisomerase VI subunit B